MTRSACNLDLTNLGLKGGQTDLILLARCELAQGELYIIGGEGSSDGFRDLFKVPLPLDEAPIPTFRYDFLQLYDEDTMIGTDGPGKPSNATGLTGKIQMCYPTNSPVYPCTMKLTGKAWWWRTMLACDGKKGCEQVILDSLTLTCDEAAAKDHPTFEISGGAVISVSDSYISGCSSKASGGLIRAFDNAGVTIQASTIYASEVGSIATVAFYGFFLLQY